MLQIFDSRCKIFGKTGGIIGKRGVPALQRVRGPALVLRKAYTVSPKLRGGEGGGGSAPSIPQCIQGIGHSYLCRQPFLSQTQLLLLFWFSSRLDSGLVLLYRNSILNSIDIPSYLQVSYDYLCFHGDEKCRMSLCIVWAIFSDIKLKHELASYSVQGLQITMLTLDIASSTYFTLYMQETKLMRGG